MLVSSVFQTDREVIRWRDTGATTTKKKNLSADGAHAVITRFLLDTRVFQRKVPEVRETMVFNGDQVLMPMAASSTTTIDDKNNDVI